MNSPTDADPALSRALLAQEVSSRCPSFAGEFHVLAATGSTNDDAKALAGRGCSEGTIVIADGQTKGRGRHGNVWHSPQNQNIYLSVVLRPEIAPSYAAPFALVVGAILAAQLNVELERTGFQAQVKWPNDVVVRQPSGWLKVAGVLVETQVRGELLGAMIVGVGINVRLRSLPAELQGVATSLALLGAELVSRERLAARLVSDLLLASTEFAKEGLGPWLAPLKRLDVLRGLRVKVGEVRGTADGLSTEGALRVRRDDGLVVDVRSGHVELDTG